MTTHRIAVIAGDGIGKEVGGRVFEGTERETVLQQTILTRTGVDRIMKFASPTRSDRSGQE